MSLNIKSQLSESKKQAITSILSNIDFRFPYIKSNLQDLAKNPEYPFTSLMSLYNFRNDIVSSSQVSAIYMLSYMDFFALYIILSANYNIFASLQSAAMGKYSYIFSLYRNSFTLIKEKTLAKDYSYAQYDNFLSPLNLDIGKSQIISYEKNLSGVLGYSDILTLPIIKTKEISPRSITIVDDDKSIRDTINNSSQLFVDYAIARKQLPKIGVSDIITTAKRGIGYSILPTISGTVFGYIGDKVYIKVSNINKNTDGTISTISIVGSTDSVHWSIPYDIIPNIESNIKIEDESASGLKVTLYDGNGLSKNDIWKISIKTIHLPNPSITSNIDFSILEQVSYIKFNDVSKYKLKINNIYSKAIKFSNKIDRTWVSDDISYIVPIHSKIDTFGINTTQEEPYVYNNNGIATHSFDYKLYNIKAIMNDYASAGVIAFSEMNLTSISSARFNMNYYIEGEQQYPHNGNITQNMFIENSILAYGTNSKTEISILDMDAKDDILEYVIPTSVSQGHTAKVKLRFPPNITSGIKIYNMTDSTSYNIDLSSDVIKINENLCYVLIHNYFNNLNYFVEYKIKQHTFDDLSDTNLITNNKWNIDNDICYMHYKDIEGKNCVAIKKVVSNNAKQFDGKCNLVTTMKSIDLPYISPIVYDKTIIFN